MIQIMYRREGCPYREWSGEARNAGGDTMMKHACPGQEFRKLTVGLYRCPGCGAEVEIFSNETRVKCHQCGAAVHKEELPSCIQWCASARECIGERRWRALQDDE